MRNHRWGALALICALGVLPACGGDAGAKNINLDARSGSSTSPAATPSPGSPGSSPSATASPGSTTAPSGPAGSTGKPSSGTSASATPSATPSHKQAPLTASLSKTCATPGSTQTLNIQTAPTPKGGDPMIVVFDTLYPDGKDGKVYGGIDTNGRANHEGKYTNTWVVALNAPLGQARVDIAVAGQPGTATNQIYFDIKRTC